MANVSARIIHSLVFGSLLAVAACSGGNSDTRQALVQVQTTMATALPKPYIEDLVVESVKVEGNALVEVIRSPLGTAAKTRQNPRFNELQQAEQIDLLKWCLEPDVRPLLHTTAVLKRRFVDRHGGVFFEVAMPARDCPNATQDAGANATP